MPRIHPTTIIEGDVELADSVEVGPWCCLKGPIKLGEGTKLLRRVELYGPLAMGEGNIVYPNACLGFAPQDLKFDPVHPGAGTIIGNRNVFREGVTVHRATAELASGGPTMIGDDNYFMVNTHVGHDCVVANHCLLANGALLGGHVHLADRVILGGNSAVHQHCRIGQLAMLSGGAVVTQDVPPFCVVHTSRTIGSLNLVGLRRQGLRDHVAPLKKAFDILFCHGHTNAVACATIDAELAGNPLCRALTEFVRTSKRGICSYRGSDEVSH